MRFFGKIVLVPVFLAALFMGGLLPQAVAQTVTEEKITVEVFKRDECTHCQAEKAWLDEVLKTRNDIAVVYKDLIADTTNRDEWVKLAEDNNLPKVTPLIRVNGRELISGFDTPETTGETILAAIERAKRGEAAPTTISKGCKEGETNCGTVMPDYMVRVPLFGVINAKNFSLGVFASILGFIDGFNPCAMWVLITFIVVLSQLGSKRKMWEFVGLFILAEAIMYYLILNVWFSTWDFVGMDQLITPIVGLVAVGGGLFFLYEWKYTDNTCQVTSLEEQRKITGRIKKLSTGPLTVMTALGIIALAFSVNIIEFACSIGVPQAFTKIIEINNLSWITTQWYMALYILFYMADDFLVFGIALYSFEKIGVTTKYAKASNLIGGILMVLLGLILVLRPEWLVIGG